MKNSDKRAWRKKPLGADAALLMYRVCCVSFTPEDAADDHARARAGSSLRSVQWRSVFVLIHSAGISIRHLTPSRAKLRSLFPLSSNGIISPMTAAPYPH